MSRKTKTICTIGPTSESESVIERLIISGMDGARFNFSHGTHEEHKIKIDRVKKISKKLKMPIALILDTKGPEIRLGDFGETKVELEKGQQFIIKNETIIGNKNMGNIDFKDIYKYVPTGSSILINDGLVQLEVKKVQDEDLICEVKNDGYIATKKNVHISGADIPLISFTEKDKKDILFAIENEMDYIAASFIQTKQDVLKIRNFLNKNGGARIKIIAKIENAKGMKNLSEIIEVADGIMVARGDLGLDIPIAQVPRVQKQIIKESLKAGKIVVTATQMLESMITNPRPTRAEVNDIANAIYDGSTCVMLSGETATGIYPVESLKTMVEVINTTEESINYLKRFNQNKDMIEKTNEQTAIAHSAAAIAMELDANAIICATKTGYTARIISQYHPSKKIIALTKTLEVARQIKLLWGVIPVVNPIEYKSTDELFNGAIKKCKELEYLYKDDTIILLAGVPLGKPNNTNIMSIEKVK